MDDDGHRPGSGPAPHQEVAPHFGTHLPRIASSLGPALAGAGPVHHLVQCSDALFDFTLDVLEAVPPAAGPGLPVGPARTELRRIGEQLSVSAAQLDRRLAELRSGSLIRLVLQAPGGACYCDSVVPGRYLVGTRFLDPADARPGEHPEGQPAVDEGDQAMSRIVADLRRHLSLPSQDPGGFETTRRVEPAPSTPEMVHIGGDPHDPRIAACREALSVGGANYLGYWRNGQLLFAVDVLDHDALAEYSTILDVDARRRRYQEVGEKLGALVGGLGRAVDPVVVGPLSRVVLDVEQGALYYFRVRRGEYLVGVGLVQRQVSVADTAVNLVADRLRDSTGGQAVAG